MGHKINDALAPRGTSVQTRHLGCDARLVEKHQILHGHSGHDRAELLPLGFDCGSPPLGGNQRLFLRDRPQRVKVRDSSETLACT